MGFQTGTRGQPQVSVICIECGINILSHDFRNLDTFVCVPCGGCRRGTGPLVRFRTLPDQLVHPIPSPSSAHDFEIQVPLLTKVLRKTGLYHAQCDIFPRDTQLPSTPGNTRSVHKGLPIKQWNSVRATWSCLPYQVRPIFSFAPVAKY